MLTLYSLSSRCCLQLQVKKEATISFEASVGHVVTTPRTTQHCKYVQCSICGILTGLFLVQRMQCGSGKDVKGSGLGVL
jgi:hypothetical protein